MTAISDPGSSGSGSSNPPASPESNGHEPGLQLGDEVSAQDSALRGRILALFPPEEAVVGFPVGEGGKVVRSLVPLDVLARGGGPDSGSPCAPAAPAPGGTVEQDLAASGLATLSADSKPETIGQALRSLAAGLEGADALRRCLVRNEAIAKLEGAGMRSPAALVDAALGHGPGPVAPDVQGQDLSFRDPEPWPEPVHGAVLLEEMAQTHLRHVVLPLGAAEAAALWDLHTYALEAAENTPRLVYTSPEKRCGKSRGLEVHSVLVSRPLPASNVTVAATFRAIEAFRPTLLADEADTWLRENEELRGVLNAGHARGGTVIRTVGDSFEPRSFRVFAPVAIAAIGRIPSTLQDRAILIPMRRRKKGETVERFRAAKALRDHETLRRKAVRWAQDHLQVLRDADPYVPEGLDDRAADNWRPLLAIADAAGGDWPGRARTAARKLSATRLEADESLGVLLLGDLRTLFQERSADRLSTEEILEALKAVPERPWEESRRGKPINSRQLASLLRSYDISSRTIRRRDETTPKGFIRDDFEEAWTRYLPVPPPEGPSQSATPPQPSESGLSEAKTDPPQDGLVAAENPPVSPMESDLWRRGGLETPLVEDKGGDSEPTDAEASGEGSRPDDQDFPL